VFEDHASEDLSQKAGRWDVRKILAAGEIFYGPSFIKTFQNAQPASASSRQFLRSRRTTLYEKGEGGTEGKKRGHKVGKNLQKKASRKIISTLIGRGAKKKGQSVLPKLVGLVKIGGGRP